MSACEGGETEDGAGQKGVCVIDPHRPHSSGGAHAWKQRGGGGKVCDHHMPNLLSRGVRTSLPPLDEFRRKRISQDEPEAKFIL